jgi:hypothetical protein
MPIVGSAMYDIEGRKYIDIDNVRIKVPWRYNRIDGVEIKGLKSIHELVKGDSIKSYQTVKKTWNGNVFYVLKYIDTE